MLTISKNKNRRNQCLNDRVGEPEFTAICSVAGATMEEEMGEMKVKADTIAVATHFFL